MESKVNPLDTGYGGVAEVSGKKGRVAEIYVSGPDSG
jgi:hypothetical protein